MNPIDNKSDDELIRSLLAETAKSKNEIDCAQRDLDKAYGRLNFAIVLLNTLINRKG